MDFTEFLKKTFEGLTKPSFEELKDSIQSISFTLENLSPYILEPANLSYGRNVLYCSEDVEALLIHMPGKEQTPLHDHGNSIGCVYVVEGKVANRVFTLDGQDRPIFQQETFAEEGQFIEVTRDLVHILRNPSSERFITFHVYSPPLTDMKNYEYNVESYASM